VQSGENVFTTSELSKLFLNEKEQGPLVEPDRALETIVLTAYSVFRICTYCVRLFAHTAFDYLHILRSIICTTAFDYLHILRSIICTYDVRLFAHTAFGSTFLICT